MDLKIGSPYAPPLRADWHRQEPLVQPCQCRGSMGGVHASCVEAWVEYHRRNSFQGVIFCVWCLERKGYSPSTLKQLCFFFLVSFVVGEFRGCGGSSVKG